MIETFGLWIGANYLWFVGPSVAFYLFLLVWGACAAGGRYDKEREIIEQTF